MKITLFVLVLLLSSCSSRRQYGRSDVAVGGVNTQREYTQSDEMLYRQQKERERHEKELQDIKRQEYYDQKYRDYIKGR